MNTTISVNLSGAAFHIDTDAYTILQTYLQNIENNLSSDTDKREVMRDIEARIAELFGDALRRQRIEVVTSEIVYAVMEQLGQPSDFNLSEDADSSDNQTAGTAQNGGAYGLFRRKMYRDTDNGVIGGVCAGLAYWLGINVIWVRLIFLLCACLWGVALPLYVVLWLLMPEARTAAQKLDMRGEEPSVENIEREVKEMSGRPAPAGGGCLATGLKIILWTIGFFILFILGTVLVGLLTDVLGVATGLVMLTPLGVMGAMFEHDGWITALMIVLGIVAIVLPVFGLVYALVKYARKGERTSPKAIIICFVIWMAALLGSTGLGVYEIVTHSDGLTEWVDTFESLDCDIDED